MIKDFSLNLVLIGMFFTKRKKEPHERLISLLINYVKVTVLLVLDQKIFLQ